ncbi:MAG: serine hydrolase domain-containing protein [Ramlibacter sp.]
MLKDALCEALALARIPGLSIATLRAGEIASVHALGIRGAHDGAEVDTHTVFEAASLTKPLVAFIALQLAEEGRLDLDAPLQTLCPGNAQGDTRAASITAAHVLSHTSGFPNIVSEATPLKTYYPPGDRFNYGSSAFGWLQRAMETTTASSLEQLARERIFTVLSMPDSSMNWQERFESNHAQGQEEDGQAVAKRRPAAAAASWSLHTTASDYARFIKAVLRGEGLSPGMHARWFAPAIQAREGVDDVLNPDAALAEGVAWGLGWGLEPSQGSFFHWGNISGFRAFVIGNRHTGDAAVWFANSARGLQLAHHILPSVVPGDHPSLGWLQIPRVGLSFIPCNADPAGQHGHRSAPEH